MPSLNWIGKDAVVKHHQDVPHRLLEPVPALSCGLQGSGNLIVQGDNLHALKALLPRYAGLVKCIYIDPPYNTGNEGWAYNDNVNSPEIRQWLGAVVGKEGETLDRHDRWLCMMYPRLVLLRQFLREDGAIFVSIDDNEVAHLRLLMDEIFGETNFLASIAWEKRYTRSNNAKLFYSLKDYIICYRRSPSLATLKEPRNEKSDENYANPDNDSRGAWMTSSYVNPATKEKRPNLVYALQNPVTTEKINHPTHAWKYAREEHLRHVEESRLWWGKSGDARFPRLKLFLNEQIKGLVPVDLWGHQETGTTDDGGREVKDIFGSAAFDTPKPTSLIQRVLRLVTDKDSLILDSFAGSGTTGHAVLKQNAEDGGTRQFILVEMDATIAKNVTAERVRRASQGYAGASTSSARTELSSSASTQSRTDTVRPELVEGQKWVAGLGGGFQFCTLSIEPLFTPQGQIRDDVSFAQLAEFVWFVETGSGYTPGALDSRLRGNDGPDIPGNDGLDICGNDGFGASPLLGVYQGRAIYLLYNGILKDTSAAGGNVLTAAVFAILPPFAGPKTVYAAACRLGAPRLQREQIAFKQTPYALAV
ncbi:MAG: site-specific DNA-methyltransferase [Rhodoferax sp.]|nr:site-specific DNA-methyltransferase [Rhodoferax sp.]